MVALMLHPLMLHLLLLHLLLLHLLLLLLHPLLVSDGGSLTVYERLEPSCLLLLNGNHAFKFLQPARRSWYKRWICTIWHMGETLLPKGRGEHDSESCFGAVAHCRFCRDAELAQGIVGCKDP